MRPRDPELMAQAARLYYLQRQTVDEVARTMDVSMATVSRLLKDARNRGIDGISARLEDGEGGVGGAVVASRHHVARAAQRRSLGVGLAFAAIGGLARCGHAHVSPSSMCHCGR